MDGPRAGGGGDELRRFRRLADLTVFATLALIIVGGVVRVSESGLGCGPGGSGTEGWPLCGGEAIPLLSQSEVIIEFSHRLLAAVVTALIALLAWTAYRHLRSLQWPLRLSIATGVLVLLQAGLGGLTVEKNLAEELVAAHLCLAMILLGLLVWMAVWARVEITALEPRSADDPGYSSTAVPGLKPFAAGAAVLLLCAIVAGGYVAGTEGHGTPNQPLVGAHEACGTGWNTAQFPGCNGSGPLSFGQSRLADIQLTHRLFMYLAAIAVLAMGALALIRRVRSRAFGLAVALLAAQIALGIVNVYAGKHAGLIIGHLMLGTALWSTVVYAGATLLPAASPAAERLARGEAAGVTA